MKVCATKFYLAARLSGVLLLLSACTTTDRDQPDQPDTRAWLAGDHHIHSHYSVGWDTEQNPPAPIKGGDAVNSIIKNNEMAKQFGLSWTVTTDHGGPNHSKINFDEAYPELEQSRIEFAEVIQFYGMELNTPAGDHSSLIIPHTHDEARVLRRLEQSFDKSEAYPPDPQRDSEEKMIEALSVMQALAAKPVVIANHPSRSASDYAIYGQYEPAEFRRWNDSAPEIAVGMAGAPGHQAIGLSNSPLLTEDRYRVRGGYRLFPTMGGFDQMTAKLGGFWDSMLGEGRSWWITANSDSHQHYTDGGIDFWPGEYSKTYVFADRNHGSILEALRAGQVFVTTGDLVSEVNFAVNQGNSRATTGGKLDASPGAELRVMISVRDPDALNSGGFNPSVARVDLIIGDLRGTVDDPTTHANPTTRILKRFDSSNWVRDGELLTMELIFSVTNSIYLRVRGTSTDELEPEMDPPAENPYEDLWFYSNPIFVRTTH